MFFSNCASADENGISFWVPGLFGSLAAGGDSPGGSAECVYFRMHGVPRTYYSDYSAQRLRELAAQVMEAARHAPQVWCILDNTALGHALGNALALQRQLEA
jgi:uncharacterized protein YecE (DUF72 family)